MKSYLDDIEYRGLNHRITHRGASAKSPETMSEALDVIEKKPDFLISANKVPKVSNSLGLGRKRQELQAKTKSVRREVWHDEWDDKDNIAAIPDNGIPSRYLDAWEAFQTEQPAGISPQQWQQAIEDAGTFLDQWGKLANKFKWSADDLFETPQNGAGGLVWWLQGKTATSIGPEHAAAGKPVYDRVTRRQWAGLAKGSGNSSRGVPARYLDAWNRFQTKQPAGVSEHIWRQAIEDAGLFFDKFGALMEKCRWEEEDIFAPMKGGRGGLLWFLQGRHVVSLGPTRAGIGQTSVYDCETHCEMASPMAAMVSASPVSMLPDHRSLQDRGFVPMFLGADGGRYLGSFAPTKPGPSFANIGQALEYAAANGITFRLDGEKVKFTWMNHDKNKGVVDYLREHKAEVVDYLKRGLDQEL